MSTWLGFSGKWQKKQDRLRATPCWRSRRGSSRARGQGTRDFGGDGRDGCLVVLLSMEARPFACIALRRGGVGCAPEWVGARCEHPELIVPVPWQRARPRARAPHR